MSVNVLLYGLDERMAQTVRRALNVSDMQSGSMDSATLDATRALRTRPDLVFCSADSKHYRPLLREVQESRRKVPVVIVSDEPEFRAWADAMDRGATDFCYTPIDGKHLRTMVTDYVDHLPVVA